MLGGALKDGLRDLARAGNDDERLADVGLQTLDQVHHAEDGVG